MSIVVEDGSLVLNANSYVSEAELSAYATARGITISGDTEQLLIRAMDYLESQSFLGDKYTEEQALQWPRVNVVIDGYLVDADEIPKELKTSQIEIALSIDNGVDPQANIARAQSRVKVGELEVEYEPGQSSTIVKKISNSLRKLLKSAGGGISFIVDRG